jgi:hypothetical protein
MAGDNNNDDQQLTNLHAAIGDKRLQQDRIERVIILWKHYG